MQKRTKIHRNVSPKEIPNNKFMITKYKTSARNKMKHYHSHTYFEILHTGAAIRIVDIGSQTYTLSENSVALFHPGIRHTTTQLKITTYERYILHFTEDFIHPIVSLFNINLEELFSHPVRDYSPQQMKKIKSLLDDITECHKNNHDVSKNTMLLFHLTELLIILSAGEKATEREKHNGDIYEIIDYINNNYTKDISLDKISEHFFMNKSQLCRKLKTITGKTFSENISDLRIQHACMLLLTTPLSVSKISKDCGFANFSYFMKQFKKHTNTTPLNYRKEITESGQVKIALDSLELFQDTEEQDED